MSRKPTLTQGEPAEASGTRGISVTFRGDAAEEVRTLAAELRRPVREVVALVETHLEEPGVAAGLATAIRRGSRQARLFELEAEAATLRAQLGVADA